jgi:magnesium chelatase family protein
MKRGESSADIRRRVVAARELQARRFAGESDIHCNAQMNSRLISRCCVLEPEVAGILKQAMVKFDMSARAYDRILKLARTIADLDASESIGASHMREAISYRNLDRASWGSAKNTPF